MRMNLNKATLEMDRLQIVKLHGAKGARVTCRKGMLWVTQEGVARDDFLAPGCDLAVETDGAVLIEALSASSATVDGDGEEVGATADVELVST